MKKLIHLVVAGCVPVICSGCAILLGPSDEVATRGKLSDAMEKASDHHRGSREISTSTPASTSPQSSTGLLDVLFSTHSSFSDTREFQRSEDESTGISLSGVAFARGQSTYRDNHFQLHDSFGISADFSNDEGKSFRFYLRYDAANLKQSHPQYDSINGSVDTASFGVGGYFETFRINQYFTSYIALGLGATYTAWSYRNNITVNGSTVSSDGVNGVELYGGAGLKFQPFHALATSLEFGPRLVLWNDVTNQKFENDIFGANMPIYLTLDILVGK